MIEGLDFRPELEQASDVACTIDGLKGCYLGDLVVALANDVVPLLRRLAGGEATGVEAWAAGILLRDLRAPLLEAETERLWRELESGG